MISRMKTDIANLKNIKMGKEISRHTIAPIFLWTLIWLMNDAKKNFIGAEIALAIMFFAALCGCITAIVARRNKIIFILFKVISLWMVSLGFLSVSYTSYYVFLKCNGILFLFVTLLMYISIFVGVLMMVRNKAKQEKKIRKGRTKPQVLAVAPIFFTIGYFIIGPIINKSSQFTMSVVLICLGTLLSYVLIACSPYYLVEYMIAKKGKVKMKK